MIGNRYSIVRGAWLAAALLALSPAAHAEMPGQTAPADEGEAPRIEVDLAGMDLSTPEGLRAAHHKISGAAWSVCSRMDDPNGLHMARLACVDRARQEGNRQLDDLQQRVLARRAGAGKAGDYMLTRR